MRALAGRRALVTGASGGLGWYIALELARAGVDLAISGRNRSQLDRLGKEVALLGRAVQRFPADLTSPGAAEDLAGRIEETLGPLDILVNNAGIDVASSFHDYSLAELDAIVTLDLLAPLRLTHRLLLRMLPGGRPRGECLLPRE